MEWHVQCKEEIQIVSGIQMENLTGRNLFENLGLDGNRIQLTVKHTRNKIKC